MIEALDRYGPTRPISALVEELNNLYHEHEAINYETTHPEIFEQLPGLWREMFAQFERLRSSNHSAADKLRILDFGCGTGFAARQCLERFGQRVERIVCFDPSESMMERCQGTLAEWRKQVRYTTRSNELREYCGFNLLVTNSVLHHLLDPVGAVRDLETLLSPNAVWLCGHEPSRRFVSNSQCHAVLNAYRKRDRWQKVLSPAHCGHRLLRWLGLAELPEDYAARRAFERSMFKRRPPARLISQLVDFHVVTSDRELGEAKGLDFRALQAAFSGAWDLMWHRTYSFLGPYYSGRLPVPWRERADNLAARYPDDGANSCLVWRRSRPVEGWRHG
jgi:2-polyprenyl-3-methyl-5-hydroxy-6-metoxy-1,4-benzoquinol methylase